MATGQYMLYIAKLGLCINNIYIRIYTVYTHYMYCIYYNYTYRERHLAEVWKFYGATSQDNETRTEPAPCDRPVDQRPWSRLCCIAWAWWSPTYQAFHEKKRGGVNDLKKTLKNMGVVIVSGCWLTYPSEKYESQLGSWHSQYMESHKTMVPNHLGNQVYTSDEPFTRDQFMQTYVIRSSDQHPRFKVNRVTTFHQGVWEDVHSEGKQICFEIQVPVFLVVKIDLPSGKLT